MSKKNTIPWMIAGVLCTPCMSSFGANTGCQHTPGQTICGTTQQQNIEAQGLVELDGTTVQEAVNVSGVLHAHQAKLNTLTVDGTAVLNHTQIRGACHLSGAIAASQSTFEKDIQLATETVRFNTCNLKSMVVQSDIKPPKVILDHATHVHGDIRFVGQAGTVHLLDQSTLSGKVYHGTVVRDPKHTS